MSLDFKKLNVASLNYNEIMSSMKSFLKQEPSLSSLDFDNSSSAVNLLCNILATGAAYNGVYAQFGYHESFLSTANLLESIVGIASNGSVLLEVKKSAQTTVSASVTGTELLEYTPFIGTTPNGGSVLFFNTYGISAGTSNTLILFSGDSVVQYTDWDFNTQSMTIPLSVDPQTINLYSVDVLGNQTKWTRVSKSSFYSSKGNYFTVLNTVNGYLITTNIPESIALDSSATVYAKAVISNGSAGNNSTINPVSNVNFLTNPSPKNGYDELSVDKARAKVQFLISSLEKCVTLEDYENAILQSTIEGTGDIEKITVKNTSIPCQVKIYVEGLSEENQILLMSFLGDRAVAGVNLIYSL